MDEFSFLKQTIRSQTSPNIIVGPGDDCSVVPYNDTDYLIASSDCLVDGIHFRKQDFSPTELAYKSLAVNISDISAMGGTPKWIHLSLAVPPSFLEDDASEFYREIYRLCDLYGIELAGGDLSRSNSGLFINVHISGTVRKSQMQLRSDFEKADYLCVSKSLGDSGAGLYSLLHGLNDPISQKLIKIHKSPPIEINKGRWLAAQPGVTGMMDVSDGLASDLARIDPLSAEVDFANVPLSPDLKNWCKAQAIDPMSMALAGGEDYCLLFGCSAESLESLRHDFKEQWQADFFVVGTIDREDKGLRWVKEGKAAKLAWGGFNHFKS